ncbi:NAD-dependent succinate-semialdehyde dehydrogenase, partial [Achromobacter denitrificans]|nr:NAD-dependent succinate-semialdehyde dehydrogenase [Achromobacter denitrificans]
MEQTLNYPELALWIDGVPRAAGNRRTLEVTDPATLAVLGRLPVATPADIDEALDLARRSFPR